MDPAKSRTSTDMARAGHESTPTLESHKINRFAPLVFEDSGRWTGAFEPLPDDVRRGVCSV